jgi:hypothetical protein
LTVGPGLNSSVKRLVKRGAGDVNRQSAGSRENGAVMAACAGEYPRLAAAFYTADVPNSEADRSVPESADQARIFIS